MMQNKVAVSPDEVCTSLSSWVTGKVLAEPAINDMRNLSAASIHFAPGQGHARHNHPGSEQLIFVLGGEAEMMVEFEEGRPSRRRIHPGDLVSIPRGTYHSTFNTGWEPVRILAVYSPPGPEADMRSSTEFKTIPAEQTPIAG
jgi:oxalate decarboxylase/phosphoglucose isomerase-like protein (cupin superfamily)